MAILNIRTMPDDVLRKKCKPVKELTPKLKELIDDMFDTMYEAQGVGLAAPQVGVLRRLVVIDVGDDESYVLINPEVVSAEGGQTGSEGCLSVPGKYGTVTRPMKVRVRALDENMNEIEVEGEGLLARAMCHEIDHLDGKMYVDLAEGDLWDAGEEEA